MLNRERLIGLLLLFVTLVARCEFGVAQERIEIDAKGKVTPFPHYWEQMFGSGRAILSLRESYREDLFTWKRAPRANHFVRLRENAENRGTAAGHRRGVRPQTPQAIFDLPECGMTPENRNQVVFQAAPHAWPTANGS